jgi:phosphoribosylformylglycinamidine synthase
MSFSRRRKSSVCGNRSGIQTSFLLGGQPVVTAELIADHGLSPEEYAQIKEIMGRDLTYTELGVFSVMWSEHCSYKNSIVMLKTLPREGPMMLAKAGEENAGVVDWGHGMAVVFKIESHNHPSAVEPYQGAATGVGGILRDIFTMGARPIACLDSLRFGDPFTEKLLLEATLEMIDADLLVGIQDMGAAGITCSCSETAFRGNMGIHIDTGIVPVRETGMTPYEILLSESQERMLVIVKPECEKEVQNIFTKWQLDATKIGQVIEGGRFIVDHNGERKVDIPADVLSLGGRTPQYKRDERRPAYLDETRNFDPSVIPVPDNHGDVLKRLLSSPNLADKSWVYHQYDISVRTNTAVGPGIDAAVMRMRKTNTALATVTDGNGRYCYLNPRRGAQIAVAEAARNLTCVGAKPLAVTNCLNFGNPYKPEMYYLFAECVRGMGDACREFGTPVTGGNVSFYNEDADRAVYPTPTIGMIGKIEDVDFITTAEFKAAGDWIALAGECKNELGGSEYLKTIHGKTTGDIPSLDFATEKNVQQFVARAIRAGWIQSAHDCSDGGLAIALFESCLTVGGHIWGIDTDLSGFDLRPDALLFGESQSRILISFKDADRDAVTNAAGDGKVAFTVLGRVATHDRLILKPYINESVIDLRDIHRRCLPQLMDRAVASQVA